MKPEAAIAAKWSRALALAALGSALAACGGGSNNGGGAGPAPTPSLTVNPTSIVLGQSAMLTWSASQGTSCVASDAWTGQEPAAGSADVTPTAAGVLTFTLTCSGGAYSGSSTQSAMLTVEPASAYTATTLVEDFAGGAAQTTDPLLVNPWGIAFGPITGVWVANNHSETATIYNGNGRPSPLNVHFGPDTGEPSFDATGIVYNGTSDFLVGIADPTAPALFIFAGEGGMIAGWSPTVDPSHAITTDTASDGAVYKGLALANDGNRNFLYATDFANGKIDVYDSTFAKQARTAASFSFDDPTVPAGFAPFGIQAIDTGPGGAARLYVSYAMHDAADPLDDAPGPGLGLINVFDTHGNLLKHLVVEGGKLNAPWGMALAPADFGTFSNALLVGNFGDGTIQGYDPASGRYLGELGDGNGAPFAAAGLWGLAFGNDAANQPHATLFFAAGIDDEVHGRYGRIDLGTTSPALGDPPSLTLIAPQGDLSGTVTLTANAQNLVAIAKVEFFVNGTSIGAATSEPFTVQWNTTSVANGGAKLRAVATDENGNVGSSGILAVNVANTPVATTLTQLQQAVFTPRCTGCHDGSQPPGGTLPGAMDLRAGNSFASLANVASREQPTVVRVKPGEPDNSYLVRKLEGSPGISGAQMPLGGPFLDQTTLDAVKSWIAGGAQND